MNIYIKKVKNTKGKVIEWLWVNYIDNNGKRQRKTLKLLNTKANMKLATTKIIPQLVYKLDNELTLEKRMPTLDEYKEISFKMNKFNRTINTQKDYESSYKNHIQKYMGHLKLDKIKPANLKKWQSDLLEKIQPRTIRNARAVLSGILKDAFINELINKNPFDSVPTVAIEKSDINPFSIDEIKLILENSTGQNRNFFALAFMTGMRSGEMIALQWKNVDFDKFEIFINRTKKMGLEKKPKTPASIRTIEILDSLLPYLKEQHKLTGDKNTYVFLDKNNESIYDIKRIRDNGWKKTLKVCSLEYRPIYQTRHTFATTMLVNGENIVWLSYTLGHESSSTTLNAYVRYVKQKNIKRGEFLKEKLVLNDTENGTEQL